MPTPVISRIAPTPSGFLHIGNALNFLITWEYVRTHQGTLILRIDDGDATRTRPQFIEDIFRTLEWLGIDWDIGPDGPDDFYANYSQSRKRDSYFSVIEHLDRTYNCVCSRKIIRKTFGSTIYHGTCRNRTLPFIPRETAKRLIVDRPLPDQEREFDLAREIGDFVLWTKDDTPAYQLVSLVEDESCRVTHIFRGEDLYTSTLAQKYLAQELGFSSFPKVQFTHHPLMLDHNGEKLAKSAGAYALKDIRESGKKAATVIDDLAPYLRPLRASLLPENAIYHL